MKLKEEDFAADFSWDEIAGVPGAATEAPKPKAEDEALELEAEIVEGDSGEIAIVTQAEEEAIDIRRRG